jgi:hypothetical protein
VIITTLAGAVAGAVALGSAYAVARRAGLTRIDLAERLLPGRPVLGRVAQVAAGTGACLPAAWLGRPGPGLLAGAAAGAVAATTVAGRSDRALAVATHALGGLVGACVRRAARAPQRGG